MREKEVEFILIAKVDGVEVFRYTAPLAEQIEMALAQADSEVAHYPDKEDQV